MPLLAFLILTVAILIVVLWKAQRDLEQQRKEMDDASSDQADAGTRTDADPHARTDRPVA